MEDLYVFERVEKKYFLSPAQKPALLSSIGSRLEEDAHPNKTITNLYIDTPRFQLISESLEAREDGRAYKEKLRLRGYGDLNADSPVFLEIKKKYRGVVYKRRISMKAKQASAYFATG